MLLSGFCGSQSCAPGNGSIVLTERNKASLTAGGPPSSSVFRKQRNRGGSGFLQPTATLKHVGIGSETSVTETTVTTWSKPASICRFLYVYRIQAVSNDLSTSRSNRVDWGFHILGFLHLELQSMQNLSFFGTVGNWAWTWGFFTSRPQCRIHISYADSPYVSLLILITCAL